MEHPLPYPTDSCNGVSFPQNVGMEEEKKKKKKKKNRLFGVKLATKMCVSIPSTTGGRGGKEKEKKDERKRSPLSSVARGHRLELEERSEKKNRSLNTPDEETEKKKSIMKCQVALNNSYKRANLYTSAGQDEIMHHGLSELCFMFVLFVYFGTNFIFFEREESLFGVREKSTLWNDGK
ncbi:hypothetical protein CEXT_435641 [Caerostris extrusa]|uniref:Uncharacterized protein n=1 Tax=Caerostris extrusa TaxID=172846 RepID=A0AAV4P586_CAEEX|nr:hypothetical protein CEXT_435641 [Caerostris extrusa]